MYNICQQVVVVFPTSTTMQFSLVNIPKSRDHFQILRSFQNNIEISEIIFPKLFSQTLFKSKTKHFNQGIQFWRVERKASNKFGGYGFNSTALTITFFFSNRCQPLNWKIEIEDKRWYMCIQLVGDINQIFSIMAHLHCEYSGGKKSAFVDSLLGLLLLQCNAIQRV